MIKNVHLAFCVALATAHISNKPDTSGNNFEENNNPISSKSISNSGIDWESNKPSGIDWESNNPSGIDWESNNPSGIDWEGGSTSNEDLQFKKKLAAEVLRTGVNREKLNLDDNRIYETVKCARCIKNDILNFRRACSSACHRVVRAVQNQISPSGDNQTVCRTCLYQAVTKDAYDCTYQCSANNLNRVLYNLLRP